MAKGKKTEPADIYKIMTSYAITHSYNQTAKDLGMPYATVRDVVKANRDKDEFVKLHQQKKDEFSEKASAIIDKGLLLLNRRLDRAIEEEETLDDLIEEIEIMDNSEMSYQQKIATINKIKSMQVHNLKELTTAIGTLYDKRALSNGEMTQNVGFATNLSIDKLAEISGFKKDDDAE